MNYTIDASVFVAAARPVEANHAVSLEFLEQVEQQSLPTTCPTLLLTECAAARATDDEALAEKMVALLVSFPGMAFISPSLDLAHRAAEIAIRHRLRGADAIYVAVAERSGSILMSWDQEMLERGEAVVVTATPEEILHDLP